jgi:protein-tyrosine kinase
VGRIDEALKRTTAGDANQAPASSGQLFAPAWTVTDPAADTAPTPEASAVLAPSVAGTEPSGGMVRFSSQWRERLAAGPDSDVGLTEQFRRLAATLHHAHLANGLRDVMLTSASPGDGKTLTAVNLALVLAESYRYRVLLIDADLRRPSIPNVVDLTEGSGLSEALIAPTEQKLALVPITARLTLLPAGRPIANSIEALTSPRMRQILDEAASRFDWIILDAPPVGPATDARLLAQMVGGTLFVIHAGQTQSPDVQKAIDAIGREQILGVVLNGVEDTGAEAYYYGSPRN